MKMYFKYVLIFTMYTYFFLNFDISIVNLLHEMTEILKNNKLIFMYFSIFKCII